MQLYLNRLAIAAFTCLFLISCSSTKLTSTWTDPKYRGSQYSHLLVIGVAEQEDIRRSFEEKFVERLEAGGIKAVESSSVMIVITSYSIHYTKLYEIHDSSHPFKP